MKERTKKILSVTGLAVIGTALILGIWMRQYREEEPFVPADVSPPMEESSVIESEEPMAEEPEELIIEKEPEVRIGEKKQEIQSAPMKTEEEKPSDPPELKENTNVENPDKEPVYKEEAPKEPEKKSEAPSTAPKDGDRKDGMIYIEGFGWIVDEGGGGSGIVAEDMYENGNKIGIMD